MQTTFFRIRCLLCMWSWCIFRLYRDSIIFYVDLNSECFTIEIDCERSILRINDACNEKLMFVAKKIFRFRNTCSKIYSKHRFLYFKSTNEKMIEIWTYFSINKQSICSLTLSKQMRSKTMWIFNCEMYRIRFWKKNACDIETCDFEFCWFRSNHHIKHLKYDFNS